MRTICIVIFLVLACLAPAISAASPAAEEKPKDAANLFYQANLYYEEGHFDKALAAYKRILDEGLESGNLYYNLANAYFKTGDIGRAILYYEKARLLMPQDADIKANLEHAQTFVEESVIPSRKSAARIFFENLTESLTLRGLVIFISALYFIVVFIFTMNIISNGRLKKALFIPTAAAVIVLTLALASFAVRLYGREFFKPAIVLANAVDCRFEPFDESAPYFQVHAGNKVLVLTLKKEWSKIRRLDGKTGWIKNEAIGLI